MFKSEPMQKLRLVCLDKDKGSVISTLHKVGILDLRKSALELADDTPMAHFTRLSDFEVRLAGALSLLSTPKKGRNKVAKQEPEQHIGTEELLSRLKGLAVIDRIYKLSDEKKGVQQKLRQLEQSENIAKQISGIELDMDKLSSNVLQFGAYFASSKKSVGLLKSEIEKRNIPAEVLESSDKNQPSIFVAYHKGANIDDLIRKYGFKELDLSILNIHGTPKESLKAVEMEKSEENSKIMAIEKELAQISKNDYRKLSSLMEMLKIEIRKAGVSQIFKKTDRTVVIEGWVPKKTLKELETALSSATNGRYYIEEMQTDELAPTKMSSSKILQPFNYMVSFISVPRSDELNPVLIFFITFPIFYGLMISDVGYGILSFFFAWYLTKITDPDGLVYNTSKIWMLSAVSAVFFGFLSNQYFGLQLNQYFTTFSIGFDWFKTIPDIILISIIFGLIHITIGLLFGFLNNWKHHRKVAIGRLTSISLIIGGIISVGGALFHVFSLQITEIGAVVGILSLILTIILSGEEAGEITNLISHPLSYARLMGFGLASIVLAFLIDKAFTPNLSAGIPFFIFSVIMFIVLHFLNMIVSMFEGAVQGARLNFIEFFTKFYKGSGVKYAPFSSKRVYTKE